MAGRQIDQLDPMKPSISLTSLAGSGRLPSATLEACRPFVRRTSVHEPDPILVGIPVFRRRHRPALSSLPASGSKPSDMQNPRKSANHDGECSNSLSNPPAGRLPRSPTRMRYAFEPKYITVDCYSSDDGVAFGPGLSGNRRHRLCVELRGVRRARPVVAPPRSTCAASSITRHDGSPGNAYGAGCH